MCIGIQKNCVSKIFNKILRTFISLKDVLQLRRYSGESVDQVYYLLQAQSKTISTWTILSAQMGYTVAELPKKITCQKGDTFAILRKTHIRIFTYIRVCRNLQQIVVSVSLNLVLCFHINIPFQLHICFVRYFIHIKYCFFFFIVFVYISTIHLHICTHTLTYTYGGSAYVYE